MNYHAFKKMWRMVVEGRKKATYGSVKPDEDSIDKLQQLASRLGLKAADVVSPEEMHATVCYSRTPIDDPTGAFKEALPIEAEADELHFFKTRDDKDCLVVKLSSVGLRALHTRLRKEFRSSHDFPTFEAHVTLCYDVSPMDKRRIDRSQEFKPFDIRFTEFEVKPLDLDWKPK